MTTVFTPGVNHGHLPCGRWYEVQENPDSAIHISALCKFSSPADMVDWAVRVEFRDKPLALQHLRWYTTHGGGREYVEDTHLARMLRSDRGVRQLISDHLRGRSSTAPFFIKVEQSNYESQDLRYAFGAIDRLDLEVDQAAGTLHAWFQDRYEWHPYYPGLYRVMEDDEARRPTNCVHAALVELKTRGAADFWMKGECTVALSDVLLPARGAASWLDRL